MNVISFSLFIGTPRYSACYCKFAPGALLSTRALYPDWEIRVYHDGNIPHSVKAIATLIDAKLFDLGSLDSFGKKCLWRLIPLFGLTDGVLLCRDIDSIALPKERFAVEQFLNLHGSCHNIVDHVEHNIELMGGLCGIDTKEFRIAFPTLTFDTIPHIFFDYVNPGSDQSFLCKVVYPKLKFNAVEHRLVGTNKFNTPHIIKTIDYSLNIKCLVPADKLTYADSFAKHCGQIGFNVPDVMSFYHQYFPPLY